MSPNAEVTPEPPHSILEKVDFGRYDAELDDKLLDYFVEIGTASSAATGKNLVIGRKGSGKTALFRHLASTLPARVVELDLENYVFQAHKGLKETGIPEAFVYMASWRFAIAVSMFLHIRKDLSWRKRRKGLRILKKIGLGPNAGPLAAIFGWLRRVRRVDLPSVIGIASLGGMELGEVTEAAFDTTTADYLSDLEEILFESAKTRAITALVDRLDDAWDGTDESLKLIGGAVRAARHFANHMKQDGPAPVIVFLRTDLWERIQFNDRNKTSQDTIYLDWIRDDLARVVDLRIHKTAGVPEGEGWATVFTTSEMRQRASAQNHMLKRALGRPRDIVAFVTLARESAIAAHHKIIESQDIYDAETRYSKHVLDELRDEISSHVRDMDAVINTLKALGKRTFLLTTWEAVAAKNGMDSAESQLVIDQLFEASAVGVFRAGGSKGGSSTVYRYQDRFLKASETGAMQVHLGLVKELGLTDA